MSFVCSVFLKTSDNEHGLSENDNKTEDDEAELVENYEKKSTKKPTKARQRQSKREEEDHVLKSAFTIMENTSANLNVKRPLEKDDSDVLFAKYIASEIKDIENATLRRLVKKKDSEHYF